MSFWQTQDGSAVELTTTFESGGGDIKPIPDNTALVGAIEEAKWSEYDGESYINLKWRVMRPADCACFVGAFVVQVGAVFVRVLYFAPVVLVALLVLLR